MNEKNITDLVTHQTDSFIHFYDINKNSDLYVVQLGYHKPLSQYGFGPIVRDHYVIHFIISGNGFLVIHNRKYQVKAGQCFLISPKEITYYESNSDVPLEYYWIGFNGFQAQDVIKKMGFTNSLVIRDIIFKNEIFYEFSRINDIGYDKKNFFVYHALLYYIIYYLICSSDCVEPNMPFSYLSRVKISNQGYVDQIINIIQTSYVNEILVQDIAKKLGINRNSLNQFFKDHTGMSIKQYLIDYRLNIATSLLRDSNNTISDVALRVGYSDPLYFSRAFHKKYNISPSEFQDSC